MDYLHGLIMLFLLLEWRHDSFFPLQNNIDIEVEKDKEDIKLDAEGSQEAWEQVLDSFKEQALKMQSISQEAYEVYSKKAVIILKETSEQLKIQAEKAKHDLSVVAKEISEEGKVYLTSAAENSPEPVKEIVETYTSSTDDLNEISRVHDFHVGIPYGMYNIWCKLYAKAFNVQVFHYKAF